MFEIRAVDPVETRPLRQRVLRSHQTLEELAHARESLDITGAFAAFNGAGVVGTALVFPEDRERTTGLAPWRLVSMAVDPAHRRQGLGAALVQSCLDHVGAHGGDEVWCHARTNVVPFYESVGFRRTGQEWVEEHTGPHVLMWRSV